MLRKKILIIDDEIDSTVLIGDHLKSFDFDVLSASDGVEGYVLASKEKPNLIILDIMMPNLDGRALLTQIKSDDDLKNTPIIIITATEQYVDSKMKTEIDYLFIKPFNLNFFILKVKELIEELLKHDPEKTVISRNQWNGSYADRSISVREGNHSSTKGLILIDG